MLCKVPFAYISFTVLNSWQTCRKIIPNALARLLAVVNIVAGSWAAVTGWFVVRRKAAGSMKTSPDPLKLNDIEN